MEPIKNFVKPKTPPKFCFVDIDGTFYVRDEAVFQRNIRAWVSLKSSGTTPLFSTSRSHESAMKLVGDGFVKCTGYNGFPGVYSDGAVVYDENGVLIFTAKHSKQFLDKYMSFVKDNGMENETIFFTPFKACAIAEAQDDLVSDIPKLLKQITEICSIDEVYRNDIVRVRHIDNGMDVPGLERDKDYVWNKYTKGIALGPPEIMKHVGIIVLLKHLRGTPSECAYIGDSVNDKTALELCGLSFAVGNAKEEVKKSAKWVSDLNHDQGAFAQIVDALLGQQQAQNGASLRGAAAASS